LRVEGEPVYLGVDLSATQDLTAVAFVVPTGVVDLPRDDGTRARLPTFDAWVEAWTPAETLAERARRDHAPYDLWVRAGWLNAAPGRMVRFDFVAARLAGLVGVYEFKALAYDRYGFKRHFEPEMDALGLTVPVVGHPQGGKKKGAESGPGCPAASSPWSS
jgi:phage terminase large subunit-like protein